MVLRAGRVLATHRSRAASHPCGARPCVRCGRSRIGEITEERWAEAELLHRVPGDLLNVIGDHLFRRTLSETRASGG